MKNALHSHQGFKFAIITIGCVLLSMLVHILTATENLGLRVYTYVSGFIMVMVFTSSIIGFVYSIRGLKDPNSIKKIVGLVLNCIFIVLLIATIVVNVIDLKNGMV